MMSKKKVNTKPVDYAALNQLLKDFETSFVSQTELSAEQDFWSKYSVNSEEPNLSSSTTIVEVPKKHPKVSMVNSSLKKLKFHLASFDVVVKERTTATAITEGAWGFEHTKACFIDEIIPFVKALKDLFNLFDQFLIDELIEVQNIFNQIEQAVEQHCVEKNKFQDKINDVLKENERLLEQAISADIVNIVVHANVNYAFQNIFNQIEQVVEQHCVEKNKFQDKINDVLKENERLLEQAISADIVNIVVHAKGNYACKTVNECERCVTIETELQRDFIKRECYDMLFKQYTTLEKHCISLEVDNRLKQDLFQKNNSFSQQSAPTFDQLFEINDLKAQSQEKDMVIMKLKERIKSLSGNVKEEKIKKELEEIETINIELDHRVTKLVAKNKHLKQTYKQLYDLIKSSRVRSKEQCDDLIKQVNIRTTHNDYLKHTQEETTTLREIVENERLLNPHNTSLDYACKYTKRIQELLIILKQTCPCINDLRTKLMAVTPKNNNKKIRFTEHIPSSENTSVKTTSSTNVVSNTYVLYSTGVNLLSSASGSQPQGNTKKDRIQRTQSKAKKNKLEDHPRTVRPNTNAISSVPNSKLNVNSDLKCVTCNGCLFSDNHDSCVLEYINSVNARVKSKYVKKPVNRKIWQPIGKMFTTVGRKMFTTVGRIWRPTRRTFKLVENVCPLTRITTTAIVPLKPIPIESNTTKPVVTLVYSRKSKAANKKVLVSNSKINKSLVANKKEPNNSWGSTPSNVTSSIIECMLSKLFSGIWTPDAPSI
nr:hypothetical protein [Tanacetum cinerariifolium]